MRFNGKRLVGCLAMTILLIGVNASRAVAAERPFQIQVVDEETGRGVPLVELETVNQVRYVSDSHGYVSVNEPGLWGQKVFFHVRSHGYEFKPDGFGYRGRAIELTAGGSAILRLKRLNIAQRLYRVTGADIYRDSLLLGHKAPIANPLLNAQVFGSDSVVNTVYQGKIYWFWGDTNRPGYPLGNFNVPGAVSELPLRGGLDPDRGVNLTYFMDETGFARAMAKMPGVGPTWIDGLVVVPDAAGNDRMFAAYVKIKPPLTVYERGLVRWNNESQQFDKATIFDLDSPHHPGGHPFKHREGDTEYVYFAKPYPLLRVRASAEALSQLELYEAFTCLIEGTGLDDPQLDRDANGKLRYRWKLNTPAIDPATQNKLIESGKIQTNEALLALRDRDTGKPVIAHGGSVYWNEYRKRWVMIVLEAYGSPSFVGEVWYAEADTPVGPWVYAKKIVTHDRYDFYNPKQHPMFDANGGQTIYFEGTYTNTFSGNPIKTPRYDYNQVMYKLELDDPRLALPVPFYRTTEGGLGSSAHGISGTPHQVAFFALDRSVDGTNPIYANGDILAQAPSPNVGSSEQTPLFYGLPSDVSDPPATTAWLYEFRNTESGERLYAVGNDAPEGFVRQDNPVCRVWQNPLDFVWEADTP